MSHTLPAEKIVPYLARGVCVPFQVTQTRRAEEFVLCCLHCFHHARVILIPKSVGSETRLRSRAENSLPHGINKYIIEQLFCQMMNVLRFLHPQPKGRGFGNGEFDKMRVFHISIFPAGESSRSRCTRRAGACPPRSLHGEGQALALR